MTDSLDSAVRDIGEIIEALSAQVTHEETRLNELNTTIEWQSAFIRQAVPILRKLELISSYEMWMFASDWRGSLGFEVRKALAIYREHEG